MLVEWLLEKMRRLFNDLEMPDEKDAGSIGSINLINWPDATAAENKKFREELREREARKMKLGFPTSFDPES